MRWTRIFCRQWQDSPDRPLATFSFILDLIARRSAREVVDADGRPGRSLRFDPHFWEKFAWVDAAPIVAEPVRSGNLHGRLYCDGSHCARRCRRDKVEVLGCKMQT